MPAFRMFRKPLSPCFLVPLLAAALHGAAFTAEGRPGEDEGLVSTPGLAIAVEEAAGIRIVPAPDIPSKSYTEDLAPPQVLEIIRPNQEPVLVGRLYSSCACVRVSLDKRRFGQGERAFLEVRTVKPTPAEGATYALFVELAHPVRETLQYDIFVKSRPRAAATGRVEETPRPPSRPVPPAPPAAPAPPSRPEIRRPVPPGGEAGSYRGNR